MPKVKVDYQKADQIRKMYFSRQGTQDDLARLFSLSQSTVCKIISGQIWCKP